MLSDLSPSATRVQAALEAAGLSLRVLELPASTRTATEAASAVGGTVGQIVKSLIFRGVHSGRAILVLVSGANRVDEVRVAASIGEPIERADPEFVRERTGFSIGGIPPVGHATSLQTVIDTDLFHHRELWAAAGTPHAVFALTPDELRRLVPGAICLELQAQGA